MREDFVEQYLYKSTVCYVVFANIEEKRKPLTKLEENIKQLTIADEAIKDVIKCNRKKLGGFIKLFN